MFPRTSEITELETLRFGYGNTSLGIIAVAGACAVLPPFLSATAVKGC